jgi:hypothetical protein
LAKAIWELAGFASMQTWRKHAQRPREPRDGELTAAAADRKAKGRWFRGYADIVEHVREGRIEGDLRIEGRHVLFDGDLVVTGKLRMGDSRSVVVVCGDLDVEKLELGDDVLVVAGRVIARAGIVSRPNEGVFSVHGEQRPAKQLRWLRAPSYRAYDPEARAMVVYRAVGGKLESKVKTSRRSTR